jgi:hypothetical protein
MELVDSGYNPISGFCQHGDNISGSIKWVFFLPAAKLSIFQENPCAMMSIK